MSKTILAVVVALIVGLVIGFFAGRAMLERSWSQPYATVTPAEYERSADPKAEPTPPAGTRIVKRMPIGRARAVLKEMTENDPVAVVVVSEGAGDKGDDLHVVVENRTKCQVKDLSGVAYGYDSYGSPAKM